MEALPSLVGFFGMFKLCVVWVTDRRLGRDASPYLLALLCG